MPPVGVNGSINPANQQGPATPRSANPANASLRRLDVPSCYSNAGNNVSPDTMQEKRLVANNIVPESHRQMAATSTKVPAGVCVANSSCCRRDGCDGLVLDKTGGLCYQCWTEQARPVNSRAQELPTTYGETSQPAAGTKCALPSCPNTVRNDPVCDNCNSIFQRLSTGPSRAVSTRESYADVLRAAARPQATVSIASPTTPAQHLTQPATQPPQQGNTPPTEPPGRLACVYRGCNKNGEEQYGELCLQHYQKCYKNSRSNSVQSNECSDGPGETLSPQAISGTSNSSSNGLPSININAPITNYFFDKPGNDVARFIQQLTAAQQSASSSGYQTPPASGSRSASQASSQPQSTQSSPNGEGPSAPGASPPQESQACFCGAPGNPANRNLCTTCYDKCRQ
ncbi:Tnfaip3p [Branchiostoma belcheri]|nr:Tnfaip3p [Branchiostoma belcheri]